MGNSICKYGKLSHLLTVNIGERLALAGLPYWGCAEVDLLLRSGWALSGKLEFHHFNSQNSLKKSTYFIPWMVNIVADSSTGVRVNILLAYCLSVHERSNQGDTLYTVVEE